MKPGLFQSLTAWFFRVIALGLALALLAALPRPGQSAPAAITRYVAPGGADGNDCLTPAKACEHIQAAIDKSASGDIILVAPGTYIENLAIIDKGLTLQGAGSAATIIDGSNQERVLLLVDDVPATPMTVVISGLMLRNGQSPLGGAIRNETETIFLTVSNSEIAGNIAPGDGGGGGIFNQGTLKLVNVVIRDNTANGFGGGIYNLGEADLTGVTLANNSANSGGGGIRNSSIMTITNSLIGPNNRSNGSNGGGIYNVGTDIRLTLINSAVSGNQAIAAIGGGIYNESILVSNGMLVSGNLSTQQGGGIYNAASGQVFLTGGSLRDNESQSGAGGALFNAGTANLTGAVLINNRASASGGGVHNTGSILINASTISTNTAAGQPGGGINNQGAMTLINTALVYNAAAVAPGGGLHNAGTAQLTNVTVSANTATSGGGIYNSGGTLTIRFSTIGDNSAPALNKAGGSVTVGNSILAQGTGSACSGSIASADYNLDRGNTCGFNGAHDLINTNPQLGPVRNNGGNTLTQAIAFSSPAVDSAANGATCPSTDQRGFARPQPPPPLGESGFCDRGAVEVVGYTNPNPLDLPPNQCVTSILTIPDQFAIGQIQVGVNLTYPDRTNLNIRLLSPGGPKVTLLGPAAAGGQNLDTLFDDNAAVVVPPGNQNPASPFYENIFKPATPLSNFRGVGIRGSWRLEVCNSGISTAMLNRWIIVVPEISDFKIYMPVVRR